MFTVQATSNRSRDLSHRWNTLFVGVIFLWGLIGFGILCMQPKQTTFLSRALTVMQIVEETDAADGTMADEADVFMTVVETGEVLQ